MLANDITFCKQNRAYLLTGYRRSSQGLTWIKDLFAALA
jgi:hypothetical protein